MKLWELQSPAEVSALEQQLDSLMMPVGLDVEFSRHFIERLLGRGERITVPEVLSAFDKLKKKYKRKLLKAKKTPGYEAILKDFDSELNVVFGIQSGPNGPEMVNITIMRKDPDSFKANVRGGEELKVGSKR